MNIMCYWPKEFGLINSIRKDEFKKEDDWPLSDLEKVFLSVIVMVRTISIMPFIKHHYAGDEYKEKRTQCSERYVLCRLVVLILLLTFSFKSCFWAILIGYFLVEGFFYRLGIIFVDSYQEGWGGLRSLRRSLMLLLINYGEMIIGFAALYRWVGSIQSRSDVISDAGNALYFSVVTITTLRYGDYSPKDTLGTFIVSSEAIMGVVFIVFVLSTFLALLKNVGKDS